MKLQALLQTEISTILFSATNINSTENFLSTLCLSELVNIVNSRHCIPVYRNESRDNLKDDLII